MQVLKVEGISKRIKTDYIYREISFNIYEGDCYAVLGDDDAGKTSILNTIIGLSSEDYGLIEWFQKQEDIKKHLEIIGYVPDDLICFNDMSGIEFLDMTMKLNNSEIELDDVEVMLELFNVEPTLKLTEMNEEMNKCIYIISALLKQPKVLVLDEPFNFLGEKTTSILKDLLRRYVKSGNTVIIASDNYHDIVDICNKFSVIRDGIQIKRDEDIMEYEPAKLLIVRGITYYNIMKLWFKKEVEALKLSEEESIFLYKKHSDIKKLIKIIENVDCLDFEVKNISVREQIFGDFNILKKR